MIDSPGQVLLPDRGHRLAAADHGEPAAGGDGPGHGEAAGIEGRCLEDAHRTVPEQGRGACDRGFEGGSRLRTDVDREPSGRHAVLHRHGADPPFRGRCLERVRDHEVGRQQQLGAAGRGLRLDLTRQAKALRLDQRGTEFGAAGGQERVRHASAHQDVVDHRQQASQGADLAPDLRATCDEHERPGRVVEQPAELA